MNGNTLADEGRPVRRPAGPRGWPSRAPLAPLALLALACAGAPNEAARRVPTTPPAPPAAQSSAAPQADAPAPRATPTPDAPAATSNDAGATVGLDALLKLPAGRTYTVERRGGLSSGEWKARFDEARGAIKAAQAELLKTEEKLETSAESSASWQVAPPIPGQQASNPNENTVDFQLRQELKRHREEIERLERRLRDIVVEANLHGVPDEWR